RGGAGGDGGHDNPLADEPPSPSEPFDPSTKEFPAVEPSEERPSGRTFKAPAVKERTEERERRREEEAEQIERRHEAVSMDTSTFMAIPAPTPVTPFVPPEFDEQEGRLGRSTAFFSIATAFSRVAGLAREIVAASYFGI